jgi:hypothetical protein
MSEEQLKVIFVVFFLGLFFFWQAIRRHKMLRQVEDHPCSKAESAAQGLTELQGFAWSKAVGPKSFDGTEMVYFNLVLQKEVTEGSGKNRRKTWKTVGSYSFAEPFYLIDGTGLTELVQSASELAIDGLKTRNWSSIAPSEKNYLLDNFLKTSIPGFPPSGSLFGLFSSKFRIQEAKINLGSPIYAKGFFETPNTSEIPQITLPGLAKFAGQVFNAQTRSIRDVRSLLDQNKDGKISYSEAQTGYVRLASFSKLQANQGNNPVADREMPVFGRMTSSSEHKLLIADCHEDLLRQKFKRQFYGNLAGGLACLLAISFVAVDDLTPLIAPIEKRLNKREMAATVSKSSAPAVDLGALHQMCVKGQSESCLILARNSQDWKLSEEHLKYYRSRACELGEKTFCESF